MLLAVSWLFLSCLCGIVSLYTLRVFQEHTLRFTVGTLLGLSVSTTIAYVLNIFIPLHAALGVELLPLVVIAIWLGYKGRKTIRHGVVDTVAIGVFAITFLLFGLIISPKLLIEKEGGYFTGIVNAYGDVAWHAANITAFTEGQSFPPQNPIFGGEVLLYPFMTNFLSGALIQGGMSLTQSVNVVPILMIPVLLTLLYQFVRELTGNKKAAIIGLLLFTFGGATLGISRLPSDFRESDTSFVEFLLHLPTQDYSGVGTDTHGFHFLNPVTTLLLPQRSFLFGIPIALAILLLLRPTSHTKRAHYITAGVFAGILPLFHGHTVLALTPAIIALFLLKPNFKQWLWFVGTALVVGLPEVGYYFLGTSQSGSFFRYGPGWMSGDMNIFWYWFKNTGFFIPVAIIGLFTKAPRAIKILSVIGLGIFIAANTWLFAPWAWDNFKLFVYFFIFCIPLVSYVAATSIQYSPHFLKGGIAALVAFQLVSAVTDISKLALPTATIWNEWDKQAVEAASLVRENTNPGDIIVTAPTHNSAVVLSGRPRYLGFSAHVWSHGGNPWIREAGEEAYYKGISPTLPDTLAKYVLVGPQERQAYGSIQLNPSWIPVGTSGIYTLYKITN